jgi:hypothetical protein
MQGAALATGGVLLLWSHATWAATPEVSVAADGIDGCITGERLLTRLLPSIEGRELPPELRLRVGIERDGSGFRARAAWLYREEVLGERSLATVEQSCDDLDDALALVATTLLEELYFDPAKPGEAPHRVPFTVSSEEDAALEVAAPIVAPEPTDAPAPRAEERPREGERSNSLLSAGASVAGGILSDPLVMARFDVRLGLAKRWALWLGLQAAPRGPSRSVEASRIDFTVATATLAACYSPALVSSRVVVDGCAGLMSGAIVTQGTAVHGAPDAVRPLVSPLAALAFNSPLIGKLTLRGHVAAGLSLVREDFFLRDSTGTKQLVRQAGAAVWETGLGLGFLL